MKYLIRRDMENIEAAMPHTPICAMLKRNMCSQRKQGNAAVIKVSKLFWLVLSYISNEQSNSATTLAEFNFSLVIYHTTRSEHVNWDAC